MSTAYTFDKSTAQRIVDTVKRSESAIPPAATYRRRRSVRRSSSSSTSDHSFKASMRDDFVDILSGILYVKEYTGVNNSTNVIPSSFVDLSSVITTSEMYIYLKIPTEWEDSGSLRAMPVVTISDSDGGNYNSNDSGFPSTDVAHFFHPIATVNITVDSETGGKTYSLTQIAYEDVEITGYELFPFQIVDFNSEKTTDTEDNTEKTFYVNSAIAYLPDSTITMPTEKVTYSTGTALIYVEVTASLDDDGWLENYGSTLNISDSYPNISDTSYYYSIGSYTGSATQSVKVDINANARLF